MIRLSLFYHNVGVVRCFLLQTKSGQGRAGADCDFVVPNPGNNVVASVTLDHH